MIHSREGFGNGSGLFSFGKGGFYFWDWDRNDDGFGERESGLDVLGISFDLGIKGIPGVFINQNGSN